MGALKQIKSAEFKILGSGMTLAVKDDQTDPRLKDLRRVAAVWERLVDRGAVRTVDQPGASGYFAGRMLLHYGAFKNVDPPVMYLTGLAEQTLLILSASLQHFFGHESAKADVNAKTVMFEPEVVRAVSDAQRREDPNAKVDQTYDDYVEAEATGDRTPFDAASGYSYWEHTTDLDFVFLAHVEKRYPGPYELRGTEARSVSVVIGAPILVARVWGA